MSIFAGNFFGKEIETVNKKLKGQNFLRDANNSAACKKRSSVNGGEE